MLNKDEIIARVKEMKEGIEYLSGITESSLQNKESFLLARYYLQILLEAMFVIGNQIISAFSFRKPSSYRDILEILNEEKIISQGLYLKLLPYAELRNKLVHAYWKISKEQLLEIARNDLSYFEDFTREIALLLEKN